eukprot:COSAG02_NODE_122_length_35306_cov_98.280967_23_plen_114_part_00
MPLPRFLEVFVGYDTPWPPAVLINKSSSSMPPARRSSTRRSAASAAEHGHDTVSAPGTPSSAPSWKKPTGDGCLGYARKPQYRLMRPSESAMLELIEKIKASTAKHDRAARRS